MRTNARKIYFYVNCKEIINVIKYFFFDNEKQKTITLNLKIQMIIVYIV